MIKFTVPLPPPINQTYKSGRNPKTGKAIFYKDKSAHKWLEAAIWEVKLQTACQKLGKGVYSVSIVLDGLHPLSDTDSYTKALFDLIQKSGVIENDRMIREHHVYEGQRGGEKRAHVTVEYVNDKIM